MLRLSGQQARDFDELPLSDRQRACRGQRIDMRKAHALQVGARLASPTFAGVCNQPALELPRKTFSAAEIGSTMLSS